MSPPPTSIDGTDITGATIDGQEVQEITVDGQTVFSGFPRVLEQFDDGNLNVYQDIGDFEITQDFVFKGTNAVRTGGGNTPFTMYRTDITVQQGQIFSAVFRDETGSNNARGGPAFGMDSSGNGYVMAFEANKNIMRLRTVSGGSFDTGTNGFSVSVPSSEWFKVKVSWFTDDTIVGELFTLDASGQEDTLTGSLTVTDSTYTSGGFGWVEFNAFGDQFMYADSWQIEGGI